MSVLGDVSRLGRQGGRHNRGIAWTWCGNSHGPGGERSLSGRDNGIDISVRCVTPSGKYQAKASELQSQRGRTAWTNHGDAPLIEVFAT
jgi:hypothetical protein